MCFPGTIAKPRILGSSFSSDTRVDEREKSDTVYNVQRYNIIPGYINATFYNIQTEHTVSGGE